MAEGPLSEQRSFRMILTATAVLATAAALWLALVDEVLSRLAPVTLPPR